jgi:anti-sigma regulatory factor (Ser/Thr protein kinase)
LEIRPPSEGFLLAPTPAAPRLARQRVSEACAGLGDEQRAAAVLLTSELVANAFRHPESDAPAGTEIEVRIQRTDRVFRVEVRDHDARPLPRVRPPTTPREGGMGLYIVDELADAWGVRHDLPAGEGKVVWFEIRLLDAD